MITITLPWPTDTSLNARIHWAKRSSAARDAQLVGIVAAREAYIGTLEPCAHPVRIVFHPPNKRRRDIDNLHARCKHQLDGICKAYSIDDSLLHPVTLDIGEIRYGGAVVVTIDPLM